jgi:hypothetical protein
MAKPNNIQSTFLEEVKKKLPANLSLVDELAELLNISKDSAYRRIRCETVLSLDEVKVLVTNFKVSLDSLISQNTEILSFHHQAVDQESFNFGHWLKSILEKLEMITTAPEPNKELVYYAKDMPIFYYFMFPELGAFKMFFWMKAVLNYPQYQHEKFRLELIPKNYLDMGNRIWERFAILDSTELWSDETLNVTLKQIEYFYDCGYFADAQDAHVLLDQFAELLENIRQWTAKGTKDGRGKLKFYKNEILVAENTILFKMGEKRVVFLTHNIADLLTTSDDAFCVKTELFINNLLNKAVLISATGEKERSRFFNQMIEKIKEVRVKIR